MSFRVATVVVVAVLLVGSDVFFDEGLAAETPSVPGEITEILEITCFGCHADGEREGNFSIDELLSRPVDEDSRDAWHRVLKNVRSQIMPPSDAEQPTSDEASTLKRWIRQTALGLGPTNLQPGRVTLRRLNRVEYRNTIRDLMGVDYQTDVEFPADDSGHGFDNVGDVLSLSPLLMEKYLAAAESIVAEAVPMRPWVSTEQIIAPRKMSRQKQDIETANPEVESEESGDESDEGNREKGESGDFQGRMSFFEPQRVMVSIDLEQGGRFEIRPIAEVDHGFGFSPAKASLTFRVDGRKVATQELDWGSEDNGPIPLAFEGELNAGPHELELQLDTIDGRVGDDSSIRVDLDGIRVVGPLADQHLVRPSGWERFFGDKDENLDGFDDEELSSILRRFATRAFRRPVSEKTIDRLRQLIANDLKSPAVTQEKAIAKAFVAILASPRFLFRHEDVLPNQETGRSPSTTAEQSSSQTNVPVVESQLIDEFSLASRLSYFLWSTMPDEELMGLASRGELRSVLDDQIDRMLADDRSDELVQNFVGQWLKARDVESIPIDVLGAAGLRPEYDALRSRVREIFNERREIARRKDVDRDAAEQESRDHREYEIKLLFGRLGELRDLGDVLDAETRRDLRRQTETLFRHVLLEDRSVLELIDNDYMFINQRLADFYQLDETQVPEQLPRDEFTRVKLSSSRRGGVLRQANFLIVTSNPTRTSPVKRGLFILDNILGTPAPPAPAAVPELEEAAEGGEGKDLALRELLELHRSEPLCASCHRRFDPMGLALENYDAIGRWRDREANQPIDPAGELISGEQFDNAAELMRVLTGTRRFDFYRCLSEKLMTYGLGRGVEFYDEPTIDKLVDAMEHDGKTPTIRRLIHDIVKSVPFQRADTTEQFVGR
ncbi:MAG: DUF1592 domain-containing protein [Planctomycetota bacterium]